MSYIIGCPKCGSDKLVETIVNAYGERELTINDKDDWQVDNEWFESTYGSEISYACEECKHEYKGKDITSVVEEMVGVHDDAEENARYS